MTFAPFYVLAVLNVNFSSSKLMFSDDFTGEKTNPIVVYNVARNMACVLSFTKPNLMHSN